MQANHSYGGKPYSLEKTLFRSASYWATRLVKSKKQLAWDSDADTMAEVGDPFYPSRDDLIQEVWVRLLQARTKIDEIWADPHPVSGGFRGVCKYVSRVVTNAAIDGKRANDARAPEILAASLDEPITVSSAEEGVNEDCGTLADTISDEIALPQAFRLEDLQSELTEEEFGVLIESAINGANIRELAEEHGQSRSDIGRIAASAKSKARKWIEWLRRASDKQVRAHISLTFEKKPCLRPDKISGATLDGWNAIENVPFHDESSAWHPPITKRPRERAKRECWNAACQNGLAIGPDNLVLPAARRNEAVRFLPEVTGENDRLCAACETRAKNLTLSTVSDAKPERPSKFFGPSGRSRNSETAETEGKKMDYKQAAALIKQFDIPRTTIARLADIHVPSLSAYLNGTLDLTQDKVERIAAWTADVAKMIQAMATLGIRVALDDVDNVRHLVTKVNDAEKQLNLPLDTRVDLLKDLQEPPLRMKPIGAAAD